MPLVAYSDSEPSDTEPIIPSTTPTTAKSTKFTKVVDRSNPHKIKVSLPESVVARDRADSIDDAAPPAKRARTEGGFSAFLPAPKNAKASEVGARKVGLAKGVNLRTGAAPAFSRVVEEEKDWPAPDAARDQEEERQEEPPKEVKLVGKPMMFKPLSVSRKPIKKKKKEPSEVKVVDVQKTRPKMSLFSTAVEEITEKREEGEGNEYEPILARREEEHEPIMVETTTQPIPMEGANDLDSVASSLGLSAQERRQLFGRGGQGQGTPVTKFNLQTEYSHNRELAAKESSTPVNTAVRSITAGKHSLQQLVNAAASQKEALEESFSRGKSNKREAGSKYGW